MRNRFIITLTISLVTTFALAWGMYAAISKGLSLTLKDNQGKLNYILKGKQAHDVLFMGSSRVFVQINPVVFDSIAGTNAYNAGTDGVHIAEVEVLVINYLEHHPRPRYIFFSVDETTLKNSDVWDYPRWFPYRNQENISALSRYQKEMKLAEYLPPVALTYYDDPKKSLGLQSLVRKGELAYKETKGFNPLAVAEVSGLQPAGSVKYYFDEAGTVTFTKVLLLCKAHHIQPVIVIPPIYKTYTDTSAVHKQFLEQLHTAINKADKNIPILDYSNDPVFYRQNLYRDGSHLNEVGGTLYTQKIANDYLSVFGINDSTANH